MARVNKNCNEKYKNYQEMIVKSENYQGIPYKRKANGEIVWLATKTSKIGAARIEWLKNIAIKLGINTKKNGWCAKTLFIIHPTKSKPCQICGRELSIDYRYLSQNLIKSVNKIFSIDYELTIITDIEDLINILEENGYNYESIEEFMIKRFSLDSKEIESIRVDGLANILIKKCREGNCKLLGPGAMSNFPDRLCGYHSYNRCCRGLEDKGRSKENMKQYNKDRRAYEYWSDGNICSANAFMKSEYFNGVSADHIGPISLGFKHESIFMEPATIAYNSAKRDRISFNDIKKLISLENKYNEISMSWFGEKLWKYIKDNYKNLTEDKIRDALKLNIHNYIEILYSIKKHSKNGENFLARYLIKPKEAYFNYSYKHNSNGEIIEQHVKAHTDLYDKEIKRLYRVSFTALKDYHKKSASNRKLKLRLDDQDSKILNNIVELIDDENYSVAYKEFKEFIYSKENKIIESL